MYIYATALEAAAPTVFMVWQRAWLKANARTLNKTANNFFHVLYNLLCINPYPTAFPYGNGMVLHFYQQQESSTTKTVHKVINKGLKAYV